MRRQRILFSTFFILTLVSLGALRPSIVNAECGGPVPPQPSKVWAKPGPSAGQVTISWDGVAYANRYAVAYGEASNKYLYGADNIGGEQSRSYTVSSLKPGVKYYFRLAAAQGCTSSPFSAEVSSYATSGIVMTAKTGGAVMQKQDVIQKVSAGTKMLSASSGPKVGEVTLRFLHKEDVDTYHVVYGTSAGKYQYGALNIGKTTSFTVSRLTPGSRYYFAIVPVKGDRALYTSDPVSAVALAPVVEEVQTMVQNIPQPVVSVPPPVVSLPEATATPVQKTEGIPPIGAPEVAAEQPVVVEEQPPVVEGGFQPEPTSVF